MKDMWCVKGRLHHGGGGISLLFPNRSVGSLWSLRFWPTEEGWRRQGQQLNVAGQRRDYLNFHGAKRIFTTCPSGKLKLASTNPRVILTGLTNLWWAVVIKINHYSLIIRSIWKTAHHPQKFIRSLKKRLKKIQDFNGIWTCDLAIPVRPSGQLSYEATDAGSRSIMCS